MSRYGQYEYHAAGALAYADTFAGLIPCKVLRVESNGKLLVQYTATRGAYRRGEIEEHDPRLVVPRSTVFYRCGIARIRPHMWLLNRDGGGVEYLREDGLPEGSPVCRHNEHAPGCAFPSLRGGAR